MPKRITVQSANINQNQLVLTANSSIHDLIPGEHMLADSDQFSFIYLMENQENYTHLIIPEKFWPELKKFMDIKAKAILTYDKEELELALFQEELEYLISNIKGNGNYGEKMVEKVEAHFQV